jgi:predicted nucleic acid-binding protein
VKFKFGVRQAAERVAFIRSIATVIVPSESVSVVTAKQDDNRILECALAARADFLVTGDRAHLLPLGSFRGTRIVTPREMLELVEGTAQGPD